MRLWVAGIAALGGAAWSVPGAQASSFATLDPPAAQLSASFAAIAPPAMPDIPRIAARPAIDPAPDHAWDGPPVELSPSIVAFGAPPDTETRTAALPPRPVRWSQPMVIRGGIVGDTFASSGPAPTALPPAAQKPAAKRDEARSPPRRPSPDPKPPKPMPALAPGRPEAQPL